MSRETCISGQSACRRVRVIFSDRTGRVKGFYLRRLIRRAVECSLQHENFPGDAEVSVTFCDNEYIRGLNREYRGKDSATDVLSFPLYEADELSDAGKYGPVELGDIVISLERAGEQAESLGHSLYREAAFLAVHSVLHLLGYDHEKGEAEEEDMCRRQREIMESLNSVIKVK